MQPHLGSVGLRGWVQRDLWVKCATSAECKTNRLVVLTVMSGSDPYMINLWNKLTWHALCFCHTMLLMLYLAYVHVHDAICVGTILIHLVIIKLDQQ